MPKVALFNMFIGFFAVIVASLAGMFLSFEASHQFQFDEHFKQTWSYMLLSSAHGHTNLFGFLHIHFALTIPYSFLQLRYKKLQTGGLLLGTLAMSILLVIRSQLGPASDWDLVGMIIGFCLSCTVVSLISHCYGIAFKLFR